MCDAAILDGVAHEPQSLPQHTAEHLHLQRTEHNHRLWHKVSARTLITLLHIDSGEERMSCLVHLR